MHRKTLFSIRWAAAALTAAALAAAPVAAQDAETAPQASVVGVDTVVVQPLAQTVPVLGRLVAARAGVVAARIGGAVGAFHVKVGDRVEKGDVIAQLVKDRLEQQRALRRAEAEQSDAALHTAKTRVALREQELKRLEGLRKSAAFSQARFEDKRIELAQAKSALAEAAAAQTRAAVNVKLAEIDLADADVRAPYTGVVSIRHTEVGAYVAVGAPVVGLIDGEHLEIEADVPGDRVGGLAPGTALNAVLADGTRGQAAVRAVVPEENPRTRTRTVRFGSTFDAATGRLAANQSVTLSVPAGAVRDVLTVHKDAVLTRKSSTLVYTVADGKADIRPVQLGEAVGNRFQVLGGLAAGDVVVVRGNERLRPGQPVQPAPAKK